MEDSIKTPTARVQGQKRNRPCYKAKYFTMRGYAVILTPLLVITVVGYCFK